MVSGFQVLAQLLDLEQPDGRRRFYHQRGVHPQLRLQRRRVEAGQLGGEVVETVPLVRQRRLTGQAAARRIGDRPARWRCRESLRPGRHRRTGLRSLQLVTCGCHGVPPWQGRSSRAHHTLLSDKAPPYEPLRIRSGQLYGAQCHRVQPLSQRDLDVKHSRSERMQNAMLTSISADFWHKRPHKCTMYPKSLTIEASTHARGAMPQDLTAATDDDDARLEGSATRRTELACLGLFSNFPVALTYLSPIVGVLAVHDRVGTAGLATSGRSGSRSGDVAGCARLRRWPAITCSGAYQYSG